MCEAEASRATRPSFDVVVTEHRAPVYRYCLALVADRSSAEDLLQETFVAAFRGYAGYRGEASLKTWLFTIARNCARRMQRRRVGEPDAMEDLMSLGLEAGWGEDDDSLERIVSRSEARAQLQQALDSLPEIDREVLVLRELEELTSAEAAEVLGISVPAVRVRLHRARLKLVAAVRQMGVQDDR